ncbi:PREDICTED: zinc finger protein 62-like isoform X1 [Rhagoletis zephyria]|uniref:zinc finger protein 62-like isoform X1 n=1 Tax=Rhagoletis zephyria TaxID=28612 RepID=UPI000811846F|nr:PREDICTED: zinc finger protein 62-like isoform X1 [Rhagoletis zephyria]
MQASSEIVEEGNLSTSWYRWCRLCAKDDAENINIFFKDEHMLTSTENKEQVELRLAIAIGKYFCVQITQDEHLPKRLCTECFSLVTTLVNFNERVEKVQQMYASLKNLNDFKEADFEVLRLKYGVLVDDRPHQFTYHPLAETHFCDAKPRTNGCEENSFVDDSDIEVVPLEALTGIEVKKEDSTNTLPVTDEDVYDFENEETAGEDPFGSDIEFEGEKICCGLEQNVEKCNGCEDSTGISNNICRIEDKIKKIEESILSNKTNQSKSINLKPVSCKNESILIKERDGKVDSIVNENENGYTCSDCSQTFKRISFFRSHMKRKHSKDDAVPRFVCSECHISFNTQRQLEHHAVKHLPLTKRRIEPCPYCEQKFPSKTYVAQHVKYVHMNERSFICEECGEAVRSKGQLKQHMLTHTDYAPFECEVCKKGFKNQERLKNHMETHNPNKHICAECGLQLNSRATLNRHLLVHSDVMQHRCDYCGRAFKRAKALKNHLILHTGLKPYSCDFCDKTFANGSNCRTHKRKSHPEELAALEASGEKTYTKNIPKLAVLKSVTRAAENLAPVVSKQSGNFAFGKKPKLPPDCVGTVSSKQKARRQSAASNELVCKNINLTGQSLHSEEQSVSQHINGDTIASTRNIPTIDNIYSHLVKQTTPTSEIAFVSGSTINPTHLDIKRSRSENPSPANNSCYIDINVTNSTERHQHHISQDILLAQQQPEVPSAVQSFCTQFIKQHKLSVEQNLQQDQNSTHSPDSHRSHLTEEHSLSTATGTKVNHFYYQQIPDTYL